jgi:hypothetical protein
MEKSRTKVLSLIVCLMIRTVSIVHINVKILQIPFEMVKKKGNRSLAGDAIRLGRKLEHCRWELRLAWAVPFFLRTCLPTNINRIPPTHLWTTSARWWSWFGCLVNEVGVAGSSPGPYHFQFFFLTSNNDTFGPSSLTYCFSWFLSLPKLKTSFI